MSLQVFKLAVLYMDGKVVQIPAGGPLEREFVETMIRRLQQRGVGIMKTQAQVEDIVREELTNFLQDLKSQTRIVA